jgi:hypothetical protein
MFLSIVLLAVAPDLMLRGVSYSKVNTLPYDGPVPSVTFSIVPYTGKDKRMLFKQKILRRIARGQDQAGFSALETPQRQGWQRAKNPGRLPAYRRDRGD